MTWLGRKNGPEGEHRRRRQPVVLLESLHEVAAALDVPPLDVRVEAGAQRELEGLAGDGARRALHAEVAAGETLVEVALLQVQPDGEDKPTVRLATTHWGASWWSRQEICHLPGKVDG